MRLHGRQTNVVLSNTRELACGKATTNAIPEWHFGHRALAISVCIHTNITMKNYDGFNNSQGKGGRRLRRLRLEYGLVAERRQGHLAELVGIAQAVLRG